MYIYKIMNLKEFLFSLVFLKKLCLAFPQDWYILVWPYWLLNIEICPCWLVKTRHSLVSRPGTPNSASPHNPTITRLSPGIQGSLQDPTSLLLVHLSWLLRPGHPHCLIVFNITLTFWLSHKSLLFRQCLCSAN